MPSEISPSLFTKWPAFKILKNRPELFAGAEIYPGGYGIIRNDELDLSCDELYKKGSAETGIRPVSGRHQTAPIVRGISRITAAR